METEVKEEIDPFYDHLSDEIDPCRCGYKPTHWSIYYSRTPYDIWCPHCKKQLQFAKCNVTGHHENAIDYWNNHLAALTLKEINKEVQDFQKQKREAENREGARAEQYAYFWEKGKGERLVERW